jgi:hypothetical protein
VPYDENNVYTPDTSDVRDEYVMGITSWSTYSPEQARAQFDRWLSEHDQKIREEAGK